jgi:exodeoxyribonuclease VII small subunit
MDGNEPSEKLDPDLMSGDLMNIGYVDALAELDKILRELDSSDVDVDQLADRVARANALIRMCRQRISVAEVQIRSLTDRESGTSTDSE